MKVLFICRANVGRSQTAMEFYNQINPGGSDSAGTIVDNPGQPLSERPGAVNIIKVMKEYGIDMSTNIRRQLDEDMANQYDKLIVMAEPETMPDWLKNDLKTEIWTIQDTKDVDFETAKRVAKQIKERVQTLASTTYHS